MSRFLLLAVASGPLLAAMAHAQQLEDQELRASPVIVTAPGPDRTADELIGNATVIEREDVLEMLAGSLGDTLDRQPGVSTTFFGQAASRPVLRGLGAERVQVLTNGIGVIDASAASPDHQVAADGIDAERIEILRGSAALAYGGQAIGGVVNVIDGLIVESLPEKPVSAELFGAYSSVNEGTELAGRAQFTGGPLVFTLSASQRDFGDFDIPDFAESSRFRALEEAEEAEHEGEEHEHDEEAEARDTLENSFAETQTLAAGLSWIGDTTFLGIAVRQQTAEYGLPGHGGHEHGHDEEEEGEDHEEEGEESPFIDLEQTRVDIRGGISVNNGFLTDIVATLAIADYDHTEFEAQGEAGTVYKSEGVEGRVEFGHTLGDYSGAFGLQFIDKELSAFGDEAFITPTKTQSIGAFLYETREWGNGLGVEGGLRIETVELDNTISGSVDFDLLSGSVGLHRHFESGVFFGGQLSYTERAPNESELFAFGPHLASEQFEVGNAALGKESGLNLEGTARWRGANGGIGINLFVTEFSDFVFLTPGLIIEDGVEVDEADDLPVFAFVQEDASFVGGEIYADYTFKNGLLSADWTFDASVDFVNADLDSGGNVPFIPPVTLNAGASADWGAWELGAAITVAGDQDDAGAGQLPTDGYTTLDLRAEVDLSDFGFGADGTEAFIEARNVTDEEVRYSTSVLKDVAPAPGQNIRVGIRVAF
ncbi:MAG: TonB-dependent receptor [Hyphomonas sp.]|uniref:TonB-dependent receptor domain-containing protein n=1 Tax=Hyphomonas sp. TaxID=87 RepID=UPI0032EF1D5B